MTSTQQADGPEAAGRSEGRSQGRSEPPRQHGPGRQRQQMQPPKQANLQFVDDTWERLLNAMERLEQVTEGFLELSATRLDEHPDRDQIAEDEFGVRTEVHLQIKCLQRVLHPVRAEGRWMVGDFLSWYAARADRAPAPADEYAAPIVRCVLGEPYELPPLQAVQPTEQDIMHATEAFSVGLIKADEIEERFTADPNALADRHVHERAADPAPGLARLAEFDRPLADRLQADQAPESTRLQ